MLRPWQPSICTQHQYTNSTYTIFNLLCHRTYRKWKTYCLDPQKCHIWLPILWLLLYTLAFSTKLFSFHYLYSSILKDGRGFKLAKPNEIDVLLFNQIWNLWSKALYLFLYLLLINHTEFFSFIFASFKSFQTGYTKLERFLHKNQHTQRKVLNFENWTNGEP